MSQAVGKMCACGHEWSGPIEDENCPACNPSTEKKAALVRRIQDLERALHLAIVAMRAPLDGWKGDFERKAIDAANAALEVER
jgi:hypothetical protein